MAEEVKVPEDEPELSIRYWLGDRQYKFVKFAALTIVPTLVGVNSLIGATAAYPGASWVTLGLAATGLLLTGLIYGKKV